MGEKKGSTTKLLEVRGIKEVFSEVLECLLVRSWRDGGWHGQHLHRKIIYQSLSEIFLMSMIFLLLFLNFLSQYQIRHILFAINFKSMLKAVTKTDVCVHSVTQSCPTLCDPIDCSPPGPSVPGVSQAKILEWIAISFCRGSSRPRDRTHISCKFPVL